MKKGFCTFTLKLFFMLTLLLCLGVMQTSVFAADNMVIVAASETGDTSEAGNTGSEVNNEGSNSDANEVTAEDTSADAVSAGSDAKETAGTDQDADENDSTEEDSSAGEETNTDATQADQNTGTDPSAAASQPNKAETSQEASDVSESETPEEVEEPQISEAAQAFLDSLATLPDASELTRKTADNYLELIAAYMSAYDALSAEDQSREDVSAILAQLTELKAQAEGMKESIAEITENNITYKLYQDGTAVVSKGTHTNNRIDIPETVAMDETTYRVTDIGYCAFYDSTQKRYYAQVTLPEGLETIGDYAFYKVYLYGEDLVIPDSVTSIGSNAFAYFDAYAKEAYHINKIVFGDGLETIGYCAFYRNAGAAAGQTAPFPVEIECGTNLKSVDSWAFYRLNDYNAVKSVLVRGNEGSINSVLNRVYAFAAAGYEYTMVDPDNILSVKALERAIAEAEGPTTLVINAKYFDVTKSIVIPAGKDITIMGRDGGTCIEANDYKFSDPIFIIDKGAKLTIDATEAGKMIINGAALAKPGRLAATIFQVNGELLLKNGLINGGAGGYGCGMFSGAVVLGNNAKFTMEGGTIRGTYTNGAHSAPVVVGSGAVFNMTGGSISENDTMTSTSDGYSAGAVLVYGWNASDVGGKMILSGDAEISNNSTSGVGGAITLVGNAELYMDGGVITGNKSTGGTSSNGGGVCVAGRTGGMSKNYDAKCVFTMNGGEISNNKANYGGGIYVNSSYVTLNAGNIIGNKAARTGGGVYVETPEINPVAVSVKNALITGNTATVMGGGMYFCPTGSGSLYVNDGSAIFGNSCSNGAKGAADDFVSVVGPAMASNGKRAVLAERMLGGGLITWYRDGEVTEHALAGGWGFVTENSVRYDPNNPGNPIVAGTYTCNLALKAVASEGAMALAESQATLIISGNTAERGGGIGANGSVIAGVPTEETNEWSLKVNKTWDAAVSESARKSVEVQLVVKDGENEYALDTAELSEENDWSTEFTGLPESIRDMVSVKELGDKFDASYSTSFDDEGNPVITVNNKLFASLTISKTVTGDNSAAKNGTYTFAITGPNGYENVVQVKAGESFKLDKLSAGIYTVVEQDAAIDGYTLIVSGTGEVTLVQGENTLVDVTNDYALPPRGSLTVTKAIVGGGTAAQDKVYTFTVSGTTESGTEYSETVTITGSGSVVLEDLEPGTYTVTEEDAALDGYTWTVTGNGSTVEVTAKNGVQVTITNTYTPPGNPGRDPDPEPDPGPPPPVEIPEPEVPLAPGPEPEEPVEIPEPEVPLAPAPEPEVPTTTIPEPEVPLADVPQTGDASGMWFGLAAAAACGLAVVTLRKREEKA